MEILPTLIREGDGWHLAAAENNTRVIRGSIVTFADWHWTIRGDSAHIDGRRLMAIDTMALWQRWEGGKPGPYILREPNKPLPERDELGDTDPAKWAKGPDGNPKDPWSNTRLVYLVDPETAELFTFSTSSWGGRSAVSELADQIMRMRCGRPTAVPLVGRALRNHCGDVQEPAKFVDALDHFHIDNVGILTKEHWYEVILRGAPFTSEEISGILEYGWSDVDRLLPLLEAMPIPNLRQALLRGSSTRAEAIMRHAGLPIDQPMFLDMRGGWQDIRRGIIDDLSLRFPFFEGPVFKLSKLERWVTSSDINYWPRTPTGKLSTEADVLETMAVRYPHIAEFCRTKILLAQLKTFDLAVGSDGRNRTSLFPVQSKTGRYQPSNSKFIFGLHAGLRSLIKPDPGIAVAYLDFSGQEFAIAAYLSGDADMIRAYESGDPYSWWARRVGAMPPTGKHPLIRAMYKRAALGILYGMGAQTLAEYVGVSFLEARTILRSHYDMFPQFWRWSAAVYNDGIATRVLTTAFGWPMRIRNGANKRTMINFPMQANGGDMLRLALCFAVDRGIPIIAPIHDAIMVEGPIRDIDDIVRDMKHCMVEASQAVLGGPPIRVDAKDDAIFRYPNRYADTRDGAQELWRKIIGMLPSRGAEAA